MKILEGFRRRRKDTRFILRMLGVLLVCLTVVFFLLQESRDLPSLMVANRVLLFVLFYINVVLIMAVLFVLARSIFKLLLERRARILGAKFRSKLVATYVGLSLVPVLVMFVYANVLLQQSVDRWFAAPVESVLRQGSAVAENLLRLTEQSTLHDARVIAEELSGLELDRPRQRGRLDRRLQPALLREDLDFLGVYQEADFVTAVVDPDAGLGDLPEPHGLMLREAAVGGESVQPIPPPRGEGQLVLAAVPIPGSVPPGGVLVAGRLLPPAVANQTSQLIAAYQQYRQLETQKPELRSSQVLVFLMVTLLVLLASTWVGLYLARQVTGPIEALAEGTRRISGGDLSHRVEVPADDELAVLVGSFNEMTAELQRSRLLLEEGNRELQAANRRLDEERGLLVAVLQSVAAGVIAVDREERVFLCNDAALAMLRQDEGEVRERPIREVWADDERKKLLPLLGGGDGSDGGRVAGDAGARQVRLVLGGEWKTFEVKRAALREPDGSPLGEVLVLEDLTELIKAQQLAAWNEAARRIAHEIKNPLTPIQLAAERVLRKHRQGQEVGEALEEGMGIIVREVETLKAMVDEFSRFARMPRPQPADVDLAGMVQETVKLYRSVKPGVEVASAIDPDAARAWADPEQLRGALINLLDNAVEATEAPGRVDVRTARTDGRVQLVVADTGRGIPPEAKEKLFQPHFSTKGRGTGLGLAIVHRVVSDHHGTIRVEDNPPRGTVFTIELPSR
ncbi:MAG TPA: ATP-binding protein [Thermoanaerobaculia bacterium]|nr:ATP-binding protein [Thermoanaerobaculia bacterium]